MKNRYSAYLLFITGLFLAFTLGFLLGRNTGRGDILISKVVEPSPAEVTVSPTVPSDVPPSATITATVPGSTVSETEPTDSRININTATLSQLVSLPGIGEVLAQRIIDYREANGPFTAVGQLSLVSGIGEKKLAAILDLIYVE